MLNDKLKVGDWVETECGLIGHVIKINGYNFQPVKVRFLKGYGYCSYSYYGSFLIKKISTMDIKRVFKCRMKFYL